MRKPNPDRVAMDNDHDFPGPVPKLDPLRDMDAIRMGDLNYSHRGLAIRVTATGEPEAYGQITTIEHGDMFSRVRVRWRGKSTELQMDPNHVIRIESTP